jgi:predicted transcriptional regulator
MCRELAAEDLKRVEIARLFGVTPAAITQFAKRHKREIDETRERIADGLVAMWIADKVERIAAYQADFEMALDHPNAAHHEWIRTRTGILRNVAEELGQLPPRAQVNVFPVVHVVEGIEVEELT